MELLEQYGVTERYKNEATLYPEYALGRIIAQHRGRCRLITADGEFAGEISGKLRYETDELAKFPTVGDFVMVSYAGADSAIIHGILTRKSLFIRKAVGMSGQAQTVAANVDVVFICMSLNQNYNLSRLERYLAVAWDSGATPIILLTKADLSVDLEAAVADAERVSAFSTVIPLSAFDGDAAQKLAPYLGAGITAAFIGSSGVGKSTLINCILGEEALVTSEIGKNDKGRHTTTGREMFPCPLGGVLIDTPGMRELGAESADFSKTFVDIEELAACCKYADCTHTVEPGCAVLAALDSGELDLRRLESYRKLKHETGYDGLDSRTIENQKMQRMFKDVGGMKNARRFAKDASKHNK